jgi:exo-beta-1,3-glucanase (GH17 family)
VHAGPNIDLCEYHDYAQAYNALPSAEQEEMDTCQADGKAFFVGETGIPSSDPNRKSEFSAKFAAQFGYSKSQRRAS